MGKDFVDAYSLLHFAVGIVAYFLGFKWYTFMLLHIIFEIVENTSAGVRFIDNYLSWFWPGGKEKPDTSINSIGDTFFAMLGWLIAYLIHKNFPLE